MRLALDMEWRLASITSIDLCSGEIPGQDAVFEFRVNCCGFCSRGLYDGTAIEVGDRVIDEPDAFEVLEEKILSAIVLIGHRLWIQ